VHATNDEGKLRRRLPTGMCVEKGGSQSLFDGSFPGGDSDTLTLAGI
jgi:hypothetical protein